MAVTVYTSKNKSIRTKGTDKPKGTQTVTVYTSRPRVVVYK